MKSNNRLRILSYVVIGYMLLALFWWAILLYRQNTETFALKTELLKEQFMNTAGVAQVDVTTLSGYEELKADYSRQVYMIFGEAIVFGMTLILGIYFINRAYVRELSAAEKQKNFLLSITHELKSPLASINLILSTFIKRDLPKDTIKELSHDGIKESNRLEELFNKILISTRLGETYSFNFESSNLSIFVNDIVNSFEKLHPEVLIEKDIQPDIIKEVDKESMVSVLKNLLENGLKYSGDDKQLSISLIKDSDKIVLSVADRGVGIPKSERLKIFDQFYRIGSEDTRKSTGTGLGLYIVKRIVTEHNGKIKVEDRQGGGTKFIITM